MRHRVVTTDGLVLAMRLGLLEACERAKDEVRRRDGIAAMVVRDDGAILKLSTPLEMNDNALWLRICRAQPEAPRGNARTSGEALKKKGGRSECEHEWEPFNGSDWRCSRCSAWGWQRQRYQYGKLLRERDYPVIARVCRARGCREAGTYQAPDSPGRLHYFCDLHAPDQSEAAE